MRSFEPKDMEMAKGSTKQLNELIDHKCRQLGKTKTSKGGAMHLAEWMKGQLAAENDSEDKTIPEPEPEIWSQEELKRRTNQLQVSAFMGNRNESRLVPSFAIRLLITPTPSHATLNKSFYSNFVS